MNNATQTPADTTNAATTTPAAAPAAPKAPSKKSLALAIFQAKMADRAAGKFALNKDFRAAVLAAIIADLGVSVASAATMYNAAKKDAEAAAAATGGTVGLGRDPKKEKAPSTGKRGRPAGSKNKAKEGEVTPAADAVATTETAATEVPAGEVLVTAEVVQNEVVLTAVETPADAAPAADADALPA